MYSYTLNTEEETMTKPNKTINKTNKICNIILRLFYANNFCLGIYRAPLIIFLHIEADVGRV